jgi:hypothetical protein
MMLIKFVNQVSYVVTNRPKPLGNCLFSPTNIFEGPPFKKSGNSKFSKLYVGGTLNLCLETPGTMQKESAQFDHTAQKNVQNVHKCWDILKQQNRTTFWTFSPGRMIGLS